MFMPYFGDTSFFVSLKIEDNNHKRAEEIFVDILAGKYGKIETSDYVLDEAVTVVRKRTKRYDLAVDISRMITRSVWVNMNYATRDEVDAALDAYIQHKDKDLSFTDWVLVKEIEFHGWHGIISFDKGFDTVQISRIY